MILHTLFFFKNPNNQNTNSQSTKISARTNRKGDIQKTICIHASSISTRTYSCLSSTYENKI